MNRYVVTMDAYVYADSDDEAVRMCERYKEALNDLDDCSPAILGLVEQPFGKLYWREVKVCG